jgi:hypothetical protein
MNIPVKYRWIFVAITSGAIYLFLGVGLPNPSSPSDAQFRWRLAAWLMSGTVFLSHILYEGFALRNRSRTVAFHTSLAVALGAFALAVAANIHGWKVATPHQHLLVLSLIIWPVLTAVPAWLVSFAGAAIVTRLRSKRQAPKVKDAPDQDA